MISPGHIVPIRRCVGGVRILGSTAPVRFVVALRRGAFELWRARAATIWDTGSKHHHVSPARYLVVKRLQHGLWYATPSARPLTCGWVFVMRAVIVSTSSWRRVQLELRDQVRALNDRAERRGVQGL